MRIEGAGMAVDLPAGWEGEIGNGAALASSPEVRRATVSHFANFPLPAQRADFGAGAVDAMAPGDTVRRLRAADSHPQPGRRCQRVPARRTRCHNHPPTAARHTQDAPHRR